jgi:hypothetical protein
MTKDVTLAIKKLHEKHGRQLKDNETVQIYTYNVSVAKSGMSALIRAFIVLDGEICHLTETRVHGCGLDRGHELAYDLFRLAYPDARYQDHLKHRWI